MHSLSVHRDMQNINIYSIEIVIQGYILWKLHVEPAKFNRKLCEACRLRNEKFVHYFLYTEFILYYSFISMRDIKFNYEVICIRVPRGSDLT